MSKDNTFEMKGTVVESLRGSKFKVKLDENDMIIICTISGKLRTNNIKILTGDKVDIEMSSYDVTVGRIVWRYK